MSLVPCGRQYWVHDAEGRMVPPTSGEYCAQIESEMRYERREERASLEQYEADKKYDEIRRLKREIKDKKENETNIAIEIAQEEKEQFRKSFLNKHRDDTSVLGVITLKNNCAVYYVEKCDSKICFVYWRGDRFFLKKGTKCEIIGKEATLNTFEQNGPCSCVRDEITCIPIVPNISIINDSFREWWLPISCVDSFYPQDHGGK
jgi:hypothetical protein